MIIFVTNMSLFQRFILVTLMTVILIVLAIDYLAFHGGYILVPASGGTIVEMLDSAGIMFTGDGALYMTFLLVCMLIGIVAVFYKFITG